jgi:hypothetical protein
LAARLRVRLLSIPVITSFIKDIGMHRSVSVTLSLYVYCVEYGSWHSTKLVSQVSLVSVEAMNAILQQDGILAFIGTKSEFGKYKAELVNETGTVTPRCWTSLPASTIMSMLGLCLNTDVIGKPEMVFYGSPLTLGLAVSIQYLLEGGVPVECFNRKDGCTFSYNESGFRYKDPNSDSSDDTIWLSADELQDSLYCATLYLEDCGII